MIAFFICNKGLSFQNDFCFSRVYWPQAPLSSVQWLWHTKWCFIFPIKVTKFS
jgi:hypothetical protein